MIKRPSPSFLSVQTVIGCSLALLGIAFTNATMAQLPTWAGYTLDRSGWVSTPEKFLGETLVGPLDGEPWVYSAGIGTYLYLPESHVGKFGAWAYLPYVDDDTFNWQWDEEGWIYARKSGVWLQLGPATVSTNGTAGAGWVYIVNGETSIPLPDQLVLTSDYTAERPAFDASPPGYTNARPADAAGLARFDEALRLGPDDLSEHMEVDPDIVVESGLDGLTFTSTAGFGNRFVRLMYHPVAVGLLDLTALDGLTGEIGVTVHASVDLGADTGGFYARIKNEGIEEIVNQTSGIPDYIEEFLLELRDVGASSRLEGGELYGNVLLETYTNQPSDQVYIELTLPPQARVTVKEAFLHMETEIRGFANLEERITGGGGAAPENIHTVTNVPEMFTALDAVEHAGGPSIIYVDGLLSLEDWEGSDGEPQQFGISNHMRDLSIIGVENNAILDGIGFKVHGTNILIKNLTIRYAWMQDGVEINDARYVHVTQCTLHGDPNSSEFRFDELMSVKNNARYVVISWNHMHSDGRGILIGSNDGIGALPNRSVIIHHNWFENNNSRHPLIRGGYTHIYNNYFDDVNWGTNVRTRARVRLENNYFYSVNRAIFPGEEPDEIAGAWEVSGNIFEGGDTDHQPTGSTAILNFEDTYSYTLDPAGDVPSIVTARAGAGWTGE